MWSQAAAGDSWYQIGPDPESATSVRDCPARAVRGLGFAPFRHNRRRRPARLRQTANLTLTLGEAAQSGSRAPARYEGAVGGLDEHR